jgi:hypothetical protein
VKAPGFNPRTYEVMYWFPSFCSQIQLVPLQDGNRRLARHSLLLAGEGGTASSVFALSSAAAALPPAVSGAVKPLRVGTEVGMLPSGTSGKPLSGRAARLLAGKVEAMALEDAQARAAGEVEQGKGSYPMGKQSGEQQKQHQHQQLERGDEDRWDPPVVTHTYTSSGLL